MSEADLLRDLLRDERRLSERPRAKTICYQIDCKIRGRCQDVGFYGTCKQQGYRASTITIVGPPTPPVSQTSAHSYPVWRTIHRRNWMMAVVWVGERLHAVATENRHLSYRECALLVGLPDHPWLGEVARAGLRVYCNHAEVPFPLRDSSRRRSPPPRPSAEAPPTPTDTNLDLTVTGREPF